MTPSIVFDFDGVLAEAGRWEGHKVIGPPRKKWLRVVELLHGHGCKLHIVTCRLNPSPFGEGEDPDVVSGLANRCVRNWLVEQGALQYFQHITGLKMYGDVYVDDRMPGFSGLDALPEDVIVAGLLQQAKMTRRASE